MNNKDLKKKLNKAYENKTPDVYNKVRKTPINHLLFIESPEQARKRKIVLILVCMLFAILAVLVVSLFSFMIPPSNGKTSSSSPYVYANITVNGENFGVVIDEPSTALVCLMNEDNKANINVKDKTLDDIWTLLNVQTGNNLSISAYADGDDQIDKISNLLIGSLRNYCDINTIGVTLTSSNLIVASHLTQYINYFGKTQVSLADAPSTIITAYIYVSATNQNV